MAAKPCQKRVNREDATCARCAGPVPAFAGRALSANGTKFTHSPGQCADRGEIAGRMHELAAQGELFAWHCEKVQRGAAHDDSAQICDVTGTDREEYAQHMREHGLKPITAPKLPRLRKRPASEPAAGKSPVPMFKTLRWTEHGEERRGQFWSNGLRGRTVIAITYTRWGSGQRPEFVPLTVAADGSVTLDELELRRFRGMAPQAAPLAA